MSSAFYPIPRSAEQARLWRGWKLKNFEQNITLAADLAAGDFASITCPLRRIWEVVSYSVNPVTCATSATRKMILNIDTGAWTLLDYGDNLVYQLASWDQVASKNFWHAGGTGQTALTEILFTSADRITIPGLFMKAGERFTLYGVSCKATDRVWMKLRVREWVQTEEEI